MPQSRVQTLRSSVKNARIGGLPGTLYLNFPDRQLGFIDPLGAPKDLVAIRYFSDATDYPVGDFVVQAGTVYRARAAVPAGPFNVAQWEPLLVGGVFVGDVPPEGPIPGQLWYESDSGALYVYYQDADSSQWVQVVGTQGAQGEGFVSTALELSLSYIPATTEAVQTHGYSSAGDGGAALYMRSVSEPLHAGKVQSADGSWWTLPPGPVNVRQFGARGDAVTDDTAAIQGAIDFILYFFNDGSVFLPGGTYKTTTTIHIGYGTTAYKTLRLHGDYKPYRPDDTASKVGVSINCTALDRPGINVQGGRHVVIENISLLGGLKTAFEAISTAGKPVTQEATWDAAITSAGVTTGRYNPYAAITIDAYSGVRPGTSYPDVVYPPWMTPPAQYGKLFTSRVELIRVGVDGWDVGLAIQPSDADGNGDFLSWDQPFIERCKWGVSAGNTQGRRFQMIGGEISRVFCLLANGKHGKQLGYLGAHILGLSGFGFVGSLFNLTTTGNAGPLVFQGLDVENMHRIGDIGSSSIAPGIKFMQCQFNFRHTVANGVPPNVLAAAFGRIEFDSTCYFEGGQNVYSFLGQDISFKGATIRCAETKTKIYHKIFHNATQGGIMVDPLYSEAQSCAFTPWNLSTGSSTSLTVTVDSRYQYTNRDYLLPMKSEGVRRFGATAQRSRHDSINGTAVYNSKLATTFTGPPSVVGRTVTFTTPAITTEVIANTQGYMPGCVMRHKETGTVMAIRSRTGTTLIAELMNNYIDTGGGTFVPFDDSIFAPSFTGTWEFINSNIYTPPYKLYGTLTSASPDITNLQTINATSYNGGLVANDWFLIESALVPTYTSTNGKLVTVDIGTPKLVMAGNAANTFVNLPLDYWIKEAPANEAAR